MSLDAPRRCSLEPGGQGEGRKKNTQSITWLHIQQKKCLAYFFLTTWVRITPCTWAGISNGSFILTNNKNSKHFNPFFFRWTESRFFNKMHKRWRGLTPNSSRWASPGKAALLGHLSLWGTLKMFEKDSVAVVCAHSAAILPPCFQAMVRHLWR